MGKAISICLILAGLLISSAITWAAPPKDYKIVYNYKNPDGTLFRIIKYYMRDGLKFRSEYYSPTSYDINAEAKASTDLNKEGNSGGDLKVNMKSKQEDLKNLQPHTVEILRNDKGLVWLLDPSYKIYSEASLSKDSWERTFTKIFIDDFTGFKKKGEAKLLNLNCDIYENTGKVQEDTWTNIAYVAKDLNVILKTEMLKNGKLVETMEASEFSTDKPEPSLFELPKGYSKNVNN